LRPLRAFSLFPYTTLFRSVRFSLCHTYGVAQLLFSARSTRQRRWPFFTSRASTKEFSSLSFTMKRRSPSTAGEAAEPQPLRVLTDRKSTRSELQSLRHLVC